MALIIVFVVIVFVVVVRRRGRIRRWEEREATSSHRRRIRDKMAKLRREIAEMKVSRDTKRQERKRFNIPSVAIAGYTNAGKSSSCHWRISNRALSSCSIGSIVPLRFHAASLHRW